MSDTPLHSLTWDEAEQCVVLTTAPLAPVELRVETIEISRLRGKVFALTQAGEAMALLLTHSMKPTARIRDDWDAAKKLQT